MVYVDWHGGERVWDDPLRGVGREVEDAGGVESAGRLQGCLCDLCWAGGVEAYSLAHAEPCLRTRAAEAIAYGDGGY